VSDDCHDPALDNPYASEDLTRGPACNGCKYLWYSAPHGQVSVDGSRRAPHNRCRFFEADIPVHADRYGTILRADIPPGCPTHSQKALFA